MAKEEIDRNAAFYAIEAKARFAPPAEPLIHRCSPGSSTGWIASARSPLAGSRQAAAPSLSFRCCRSSAPSLRATATQPTPNAYVQLGKASNSRSPHFRIAKNVPISGTGDLISTTMESSMASNPWRTPSGCRQTSPGPMMNSSEPTVDFILPFTT